MLEELIEQVRKAHKVVKERDWVSNSEADMCYRELEFCKMRIADFILAHADTFIAWEREHAVRTSPFEE